MTSALIIADYMLATSDRPLTPMRVNRLSYISHGFTLAIENEPLFDDAVEAWRYGPVVPSIYHALKRYRDSFVPALYYCGTQVTSAAAEDRLGFFRGLIPDKHESIIREVLGAYGGWSGPGLSTLTHEKGSPWHRCKKAGGLGAEIPNRITREYYRGQVLWAGQRRT